MNPLFVCGMPRTGTGILTDTLNTHPEIQLHKENKLVWTMCQYLSKLSTAYPITPFEFGLNVNPGELDDYKATFANRFAQIAKEKLSKRSGIKYFGDKYPHLIFQVDTLKTIFPHAKVIFTLRDKSECVKSILNKSWGECVDKSRWEFQYDRSVAIIEKHLENPSYRLVRLEDALLDKEAVFSDIAEWLGVENVFNLGLINAN